MKLENKIFSKKIIVESNSTKNICIIDINKNDITMNIDVDVYEGSKLIITLASLSYSSNKNFNFNINHLSNTSESECNVFGVAKNKGQIKFDLTANIKEDSEKNLCKQSISGVLLSSDSSIIGSPNLIINTNSIKAKHSLAIGKIHDNRLSYLISKGINKKEAIFIIIMSYFNLSLDNIIDESKKEYIKEKIKEKYNERL